jgi:hypothetical protein
MVLVGDQSSEECEKLSLLVDGVGKDFLITREKTESYSGERKTRKKGIWMRQVILE